MASIDRLSTSAVPPSERLKFWNDTCMNAYGAKVVDAESARFEGMLATFCSDELVITSVKSTPAVCRTSTHHRRRLADDAAFSLQLVHSGHCRMSHAGVKTFAMPGDMFMVDGHRRYELAFTEPVQGLVLSPPWSRFHTYAAKLEALAGRPLNVSSGAGAVLSHFVRNAWDQLASDTDEEWPRSATTLIWDLLEAMLLGEPAGEIAAGRSVSLRRDARTLVDARFRDSSFQSSDIATALGVSSRYLQLAFAEAGITPSRFLLARRLDAAATQLLCATGSLCITEVALDCGFNDLSYFSRVFRRRFGMTARAFRNGSDASVAAG